MKKLLCSILFLLLISSESKAQTLVLDTTFKPFFQVRDHPPLMRPSSLRTIWENPKTGVIFTVGAGGLYTCDRNGDTNRVFTAPLGGGGITRLEYRGDSALILMNRAGYWGIDSTGKRWKAWDDWLATYRQTVTCLNSVYPFFFDDGSSLMINQSPGNPNGPGVNCKIVNPPDTFPHRFLIKVDPQGYWDSTFVPDAQGDLWGLLPYDSTRIWVFGIPRLFTHYDGVQINGLCRIYHDGTLDTTFKSPLEPFSSGILIPTLTEEDGGFFLTGVFFLKNNDSVKTALARFHADGSLDSSFIHKGAEDTTGFDFIGTNSIVPTPDKGYLVAGAFNQYQGVPAHALAKLDSNGRIQPEYFTSRGPDSATTFPENPGEISQILPSKFGGYYVIGDWRYWDGKRSEPIVRLIEAEPVGLEEEARPIPEVRLYPNPAKELLQVKIKSRQAVQYILLYDLLGRKQEVDLIKEQAGNYQLNLAGLIKGVYLLNIQLENGIQVSRKILKE